MKKSVLIIVFMMLLLTLSGCAVTGDLLRNCFECAPAAMENQKPHQTVHSNVTQAQTPAPAPTAEPTEEPTAEPEPSPSEDSERGGDIQLPMAP